MKTFLVFFVMLISLLSSCTITTNVPRSAHKRASVDSYSPGGVQYAAGINPEEHCIAWLPAQ